MTCDAATTVAASHDAACYYFNYVFLEVQQVRGMIDACLRDRSDAIFSTFPSDLIDCHAVQASN